MAARLVFPAGGRGHAPGGGTRMQGRAFLARHVRCVDPWQDRDRRAGRGRVHEPHVHQCLDQARTRPLPLRGDARRGRLHPRRRRHRPAGPGPLPRHHHDRWCRAGARHDGGLPADGVAGAEGVADVHHRAVGGDRAQRAERPEADRAAGRGHRPVRRGVPAHVRGGGKDLRRADAAVPRVLHGRAWLRGQRARAVRPRRVGTALRSRAAVRHHALRHGDHARAAGRKGLHHRRPGHRRHPDAG